MSDKQTIAEVLRGHADKAGIPLRTLDQVRAALARAKKNKCEERMARLMLRHGRLTDEAILYVRQMIGD